MEKKTIINNSRILIFNMENTDREIREYFDAKNFTNYSLQKKDDYFLKAYCEDEDEKFNIVFEFDINHPLYFALLHLLNGDESLIIDDDFTRSLKEKYLEIYMNDNKIVMNFVNYKEGIEFDKFGIFVKNISYDLSSKIDNQGLDTKERLRKFFIEATNALTEDYHQITLEEFIAKQKILKK